MHNRFFTKTEFNDKFGKELTSATSVYERREKSGMQEYSIATYDFVFISDTKEKLDLLGNFLKENYGYRVGETTKGDDYWEISGHATEFPVDENNLMYW